MSCRGRRESWRLVHGGLLGDCFFLLMEEGVWGGGCSAYRQGAVELFEGE